MEPGNEAMDNQLANLCGDKRETSLHVNDVTAEGNETFICLSSYRRKGVTCLPSTIALRSLIEHDVGIRAKSHLFTKHNRSPQSYRA